jgi:hypothetical protein
MTKSDKTMELYSCRKLFLFCKAKLTKICVFTVCKQHFATLCITGCHIYNKCKQTVVSIHTGFLTCIYMYLFANEVMQREYRNITIRPSHCKKIQNRNVHLPSDHSKHAYLYFVCFDEWFINLIH